jgi:gas vesicle protein
MSKADRLADNRKWARDVRFLITGVGIGAGLALLFAPRTGNDLRHEIGRNCRRAAKHVGRHTDEFRDRAEDLFEHAQHLRDLGVKLLHFGHSHKAA